MTSAFADDELAHGVIRYEGGWDLFMTRETWLDLMWSDAYGDVAEAVRAKGPGVHSVLDLTSSASPDFDLALAAEVALSLAMADRVPSSVCAHPPCLQDVAEAFEGWFLCRHHCDLMKALG